MIRVEPEWSDWACFLSGPVVERAPFASLLID